MEHAPERRSNVSVATMRAVWLILCAGCSFTLPAEHAIDDGKPADGPTNGAADASIDAAVFDPAQCPAGYANNGITASPDSRYRLIDSDAAFATHHVDCNDDKTGWTHLVVLDTVQEAQQIRAIITTRTYYAGVVQPRSSGQPGAGWLLFNGAGMATGLWQSGQPNDNSGSENNEQNFAAADDGTGLLNDVSGTTSYRGVCECDGKPIPKSVSDTIAAE
jgi:hypothetical protein